MGSTTLFHRFEVLCFGWDAQHDRILDELLDAGIDAVYSDHVDRMVDALARVARLNASASGRLGASTAARSEQAPPLAGEGHAERSLTLPFPPRPPGSAS